jgi:hypothetical protein
MNDSATDTAFSSRLTARRERQGRVGILRNPNSPPAAPARRVTLTGKWMRLRSTRRPSAAVDLPDPAPLPAEPVPIVVEGEDGVRINLAELQKTVAEIAPKPQRTAFAQNFRHDLPDRAPKPTPRPKREAQVDLTVDLAEEPPPAAEPLPPRSVARRWAAIGLCALLVGGTAALWFFLGR